MIIQGKLVGNAMTEAGIVAQPKVRPQTASEKRERLQALAA